MLKSAFNTVAMEKEKIKSVFSDQEQSERSAQVITLRKSLSQVRPAGVHLEFSFYTTHNPPALGTVTING